MPKASRPSAQEAALFSKYMAEHRLRRGRRRQEVLSEFLSTERHVTAEELHEAMKRKGSGPGIATVHRCLELFAACGLARKLKFGNGKTSYEHDYGHTHHDHLICRACGRTEEFCDPLIEKLQEKAASKHGFVVETHSLQLCGLCASCRAKGEGR